MMGSVGGGCYSILCLPCLTLVTWRLAAREACEAFQQLAKSYRRTSLAATDIQLWAGILSILL